MCHEEGKDAELYNIPGRLTECTAIRAIREEGSEAHRRCQVQDRSQLLPGIYMTVEIYSVLIILPCVM